MEEISSRKMFLEEICCRRSYVACRRRYVVGGDMLLKEISCWRRYVAGRDINGDI